MYHPRCWSAYLLPKWDQPVVLHFTPWNAFSWIFGGGILTPTKPCGSGCFNCKFMLWKRWCYHLKLHLSLPKWYTNLWLNLFGYLLCVKVQWSMSCISDSCWPLKMRNNPHLFWSVFNAECLFNMAFPCTSGSCTLFLGLCKILLRLLSRVNTYFLIVTVNVCKSSAFAWCKWRNVAWYTALNQYGRTFLVTFCN